MDPKQLPPSMKALKPYLTHAKQVDGHDPVMAYYCRCFAVQLGVQLRQQNPDDPSSRAVLLELLDGLEAAKARLGEQLNQTDGQEYVERFSLKVFDQADQQDRQGNATKITARSFYAASIFLNTLRQFSDSQDLPEELEQKLKYAKWKAADITTALREGRVPTPGPAGGMDEDSGGGHGGAALQPDSAASESMAPGGSVGGDFGGQMADAGPMGGARGMPDLGPPPSGAFGSGGQGGSGAPAGSSGGRALGSVPSTDFSALGMGGFSPAQPPSDAPAASHVADRQLPGGFNLPTPPKGSTVAHSGNAEIPSAELDRMKAELERQKRELEQEREQFKQMKVQQQKEMKKASYGESPSYDAHGVPPEQMSLATKHARFAISALSFEDVGTAVKELRVALQALEPYVR